MADPNSNVPNVPNDDDPIPNFDEIFMPDGSLRVDYQGLVDQPTDENTNLNEDMDQLGDYNRKGKNVMLDEDVSHFEDSDGSSENKMNDEDTNQFEDYRHIGTNTMFNDEAGPSGVDYQTNAQMRGMFSPKISVCDNPIQIPEWPLPAIPFACSCCQVLREIIHTIEGESRKFEIHGRLGIISHGILEIRRNDTTGSYKEYHMFDFCKESLQRVKMFLEEYCEKQKMAGYTMVKDPLLTFYQAVSAGLSLDINIDLSDILQGSPVHIGDMRQPNVAQPQGQPNVAQPQDEPNVAQPQGRPNVAQPQGRPNVAQPQDQPNVAQPRGQSNEVRSSRRRPRREQMDRIAKLTVHELSKYFHIKLEDAANIVGVSSTKCKEICRDGGVKRWPYRTVRKLRRQITQRRRGLNSANAEERERAEADIEKLNRQLAECYPPLETEVVDDGNDENDNNDENDENNATDENG
ncbi:uncharacterized protein LOC141672733 [Apium graveolens]|uniref:uncharacterized protein LOC141672733 n=1 Tax=Apium graveolens TaxID=4045 RepID=UPI003D7A83FB